LPAVCRVTAVVTVTDDGGSSGALRKQYGVFPPGDIRNCLLALGTAAPEVAAALQYRLNGPGGPQHPVGNLLLAALGRVVGDDLAAIRLAGAMLGVEDAVLPATTERVHLVAELADGRRVTGESEIARSGAAITRVHLDPEHVAPAPGIVEAIHDADAVVIGPGSLYTSVLAALVVPGIAEAVAATRATRIFVSNLMTEPGETDGYGVRGHLEALAAHGLAPELFDFLILNHAPIPADLRARYAAAGAEPVPVDLVGRGDKPTVIFADVLEPGQVIRHSADRLGVLLCDLATAWVDVPEARL
jgi:uncharacterized cofD-like protein